jgi:hypothetical protein
MKFAAALAGAAAKDALFFAGTLVGSFLGGAEQALDRRKRITYVPGVGYTRR